MIKDYCPGHYDLASAGGVVGAGEDDDISKRIRTHGLSIVRYPITIARYKMLQHPKETPNRRKGKNLRNADRYDSFDGLENTRLFMLI